MNELKRIFGKRYACLLLLLLAVNMLIIISDNTDAQMLNAYIDMINIVDKYMEDESSCTAAAGSSWREYFDKNEIDGSDTSEKTAIAKQAREKLVSQAKYIDNYKDIVESKKQTAILYAASGTYKKNGFEYNNLLKTQYDLSGIYDTDVQLSNGVWLQKIFENNYIHLLAFVTSVFTVYMFFAERKNGLCYIVHTSKNGRCSLFIKRCGVLMLQTTVTNALLYFEAAFILLNKYGGWNGLGAAASSDEYFLLTSGNLSRIEMLCLIILLSVLTTMVLSLVLWLLLLCFSNVNIGLFCYTFICMADILLYMIMSGKSVFRIFKYVNIYYMFFPCKALGYYNWGFYGMIISLRATTILVSVIIGIMALGLSAYISINKYFTAKKNWIENVTDFIHMGAVRLMENAGNSWKEVYKILISQGMILILLLLMYLCANVTPGHGVVYDARKSYMLGYYEKAEGLKYGLELENIYNQYREEYEQFVSDFDYSVENAQIILANKKDLFNSVEENVNYIKEMNEQGISAVVINPYSYTDTIGDREWSNQELIALINVIAAIIVSCGFMSYEKKSSVQSLTLSGRERRKWLIKKMLVQNIICLVFMCITYGMYYKKLCDTYTYVNITAPLKSIMIFRNFIVNPPIIGYVIIDFAVKYMFMVVIQLIMSVVSIYVKYIYCFAVGIVLVLPHLLYMIGFNFLHNVSVVKYISFFQCLLEGGRTMDWYWILLIVVVLTGAGMWFYIVNVFEHKLR